MTFTCVGGGRRPRAFLLGSPSATNQAINEAFEALGFSGAARLAIDASSSSGRRVRSWHACGRLDRHRDQSTAS